MPIHPNDVPIDTDLSPDDTDVCTAQGFVNLFKTPFAGPGIYNFRIPDSRNEEYGNEILDTLIVMPEGVNANIWKQSWPDDTQYVVFVYYNRNPMSLFGMLGSAPMRIPATE